MRNRVITAFLLLFIAIFVIYHGQLPMFLWVLFVGTSCSYELIQMAKKNNIKPYSVVIYTLVTAAIASAYLPMTKAFWLSPFALVIAVSILLLALIELWQKKLFFAQNRVAMTGRIAVFVSFTSSYVYLLRDGKEGILHILFCLLIIWSTDVLALLGGRMFGKTPLSPISPNKTREGSLIGLIGSVIISCVYILVVFTYFDIQMNFLLYTGFAIVVSLVAQIGDLHESLVKRRMNVKDSSNILPGHGGIYDRADSTLFVMPLVFYLLNY